MNPPDAAGIAPAPATLAKGQAVSFKGLSGPPSPGYTPTAQPGDKCVLGDFDEADGTWGVTIVAPGTDRDGKLDAFLPEEVAPWVEPAAAGTPPPAAPKKRGAAAKATKPAEAQAAPPPPPAGDAKAKKGKKAEAAPKAEKPKKEEVKKPEEVLVDTKSVTEALAGRTQLQAASFLVEKIRETYFTLGGVLAHILKERSFAVLRDGNNSPIYADSQEGFVTYCGAELGIGGRKAYDLIAIYKHFSAANFDAADLTSRIGWAKANQIAAAVGEKPEKAAELVEYAATHGREEIDQFVKTVRGKGGDGTGTGSGGGTPAPVKVRFQFSLVASMAEGAKAAIEAARKKLPEGGNSESDGFALIATEWGAMQAGVNVPLDQLVPYLESKYGVKISVQAAGEMPAAVQATVAATAAS